MLEHIGGHNRFSQVVVYPPMPLPESIDITFISSDSQIRYQGAYCGFNSSTGKLKATSVKVWGTESRLPAAPKAPSSVTLQHIEVEVSTLSQLRSVDHDNIRVAFKSHSTGQRCEGYLLAHIPQRNLLAVCNCRRVGGRPEEVEPVVEVCQRCPLPLGSYALLSASNVQQVSMMVLQKRVEVCFGPSTGSTTRSLFLG